MSSTPERGEPAAGVGGRGGGLSIGGRSYPDQTLRVRVQAFPGSTTYFFVARKAASRSFGSAFGATS